MPAPARRSRLVALGLSVGSLIGLVTGMVATEHPVAGAATASSAPGPTATAPDPFAAGAAATPPTGALPRFRQTITSAS